MFPSRGDQHSSCYHQSLLWTCMSDTRMWRPLGQGHRAGGASTTHSLTRKSTVQESKDRRLRTAVTDPPPADAHMLVGRGRG